MTDPTRPWSEKYSRAIGLGPESANTSAQRARLLMAYRAQASRKRPTWRASWMVPAASALALLFYFILPRLSSQFTQQPSAVNGVSTVQPSAVEPRVRGEKVAPGAALTPVASPEVIAFGEGSRMTLAPETTARLVSYSDQYVEVHLEEGKLEADVRKRPGSRWVVKAGSYQVVVVGTAFTVDYDSARASMNVSVSRGAVRVLGEGLSTQGVLVQAGGSFAHQNPVPAASADGSAQPDAGDAAPGEPPAFAADEPEIRSERLPASALAPVKSETWRRLAEAGDSVLALREVERVGTQVVLRSSSPEDLILLGNAARFAGQPDLAEKAYHAARTRGGGGAAAALCAYYLARLALDVRGDSTAAIRWLRTYLSEAESGSLAPNARARLMELLSKTGDVAGAKTVAEQYVKLHPNGQHIEQARRLVGVPAHR